MQKKVAKDINSYSKKVFMGFTLRQTITFAIAAAIGAPTYYFTYKSIGTTAAGWLVLLLIIPVIIVGIVPIHGMTAEKYLLVLLQSGRQSVRLYKNEGVKNDNAVQVKKRRK